MKTPGVIQGEELVEEENDMTGGGGGGIFIFIFLAILLSFNLLFTKELTFNIETTNENKVVTVQHSDTSLVENVVKAYTDFQTKYDETFIKTKERDHLKLYKMINISL